MTDADFSRLIARDAGDDLTSLEHDIWMRESQMRNVARITRHLASWQGLIVVLAMVVSATAGMTSATLAAHRSDTPLASDQRLAPSTLLFGAQR